MTANIGGTSEVHPLIQQSAGQVPVSFHEKLNDTIIGRDPTSLAPYGQPFASTIAGYSGCH